VYASCNNILPKSCIQYVIFHKPSISSLYKLTGLPLLGHERPYKCSFYFHSSLPESNKWQKEYCWSGQVCSFIKFVRYGKKINSWIDVGVDFFYHSLLSFDGLVFSSQNLLTLNQCNELHKMSSITFVSFCNNKSPTSLWHL